MSGVNIDEPGFTAPAGSAPPSSDSSADPPPESRKKCVSCLRRMSTKTADRHTVCVHLTVISKPAVKSVSIGLRRSCVCILRCENPLRPRTPHAAVIKLRLLRLLLRPHRSPLRSLTRYPKCRVRSMLNSMSETFLSRLDALQASLGSSSLPESSSRPSHRSDGGAPQPGVTTDESRMFQAMGEPTGKSRKSSSFAQVSPPRQEFAFPSAASQSRDAPRPHPQPSAFVPPPPPQSEVPPQPSSSGWVPSGPPPSPPPRFQVLLRVGGQ